MAKVSTNQFKSGLKIMIDGDPCSIIQNEMVKPGKGQAFNRVKIRHLKSGRVLERTFKSGESVDKADVTDVSMLYLYNDGELWHFMNESSYEQFSVDKNIVADAGIWLKEQDPCEVTLWNGAAISVQAPNFVVLKVVDCEPGVKGDTVSGGSKPVTLETGAVIRVPLFIESGEMLRIDTRKKEYVSRVNSSE